MKVVLVPCLVFIPLVIAVQYEDEGVEFDSGLVLYPIDESTLEPPLDTELADDKDTGSHLFLVEHPEDAEQKLTLNYRVSDFKSPQSDYYRAHPIFMRCLQKVHNYVRDVAGYEVKILSGYKTSDEIDTNPSVSEEYSRTGSGATLGYDPPLQEDDLLVIAEAAIVLCMPMFGYEMQDIGLIMLPDGVHIHMAGSEDTQPYFASEGFPGMDSAEFTAWSWQRVDLAADPIKSPQCENVESLQPGEAYPPGVTSPEEVVGALDVNVTREMTEDFQRLIQFQGSNVVFDGCTEYMEGHAQYSRCTNRMAAPRLYSGLRMLQLMVRENINGVKMRVTQAWSEDTPGPSLHNEGRAATVELDTDNTAENLETLSLLAVCAGLDYVKHEGDHILVASRKQAHRQPTPTKFPESEVQQVAPPAEKTEYYALPWEQEGEEADYPLYDSDHQDSFKLGEYATVGMFKSHDPTYRYYRLHPRMVQCYDAIRRYEDLWSEEGPIDVQVVRSFMSSPELEAHLDPDTDPRGTAYTLGFAFELTYDPALNDGDLTTLNGSKYNIDRLTNVVVQECGPLFFEEGYEMGLGLYENSLYVDMRDIFHLWMVAPPTTLPSGELEKAYANRMARKLLHAIEGRLVNPVNPEEALKKEVNPPQKQSPDYRHQRASSARKARRAPKQQSESQECVPQSDTDFCHETKKHRDAEVEHVWEEFRRLHMEHDEEEIRQALTGCLGACGTCTEGAIYEDKTEHCDNLLHWSPFRVLNNYQNVTNLHQRDNLNMQDYACFGSRHCLNKAPVFAILATSIEHLYRPDPERSVEEELYGLNDNPLPFYELVLVLYAIHAEGTVTVWIQNEQELKDLRSPLKTAMVYNKEVSDVVIYVADEETLPNVEQALQAMISDWTRNTHPHYTREAVTDFVLKPVPQGMAKRSVTDDFQRKLQDAHRHWEQRWLAKTLT